MSRFRDTFVGNADSHSTFRFGTDSPLHLPYSPVDSLLGYHHGAGSALRDDVSYQRPPGPPPGHKDTKTPVDAYELRPLPSTPSNPFELPDLPRMGAYSHSQGYFGEVSDTHHAQGPLGAYPMDTLASEKDLLHKRFVRNERNRRKLETRLPRFHYTKLPWFTILATSAQVILFIVELVRMGVLTGSPFQTQPYFNPMLGPSTYVLINMGARYVPCMHEIEGATTDTSILFPCPNSTTTDTNVCSLNELCGMTGIPIVDGEFKPHQLYRIVVPIFLHAGFLHILFNLFLQLSMGIAVERSIGWLKYAIIYMASGISGFLLGANFSPNGIASTGASGSLFGIIATNLLLFIYCGKTNTNIYATKHYKSFICIMILEIVVSFVLGLLPGLDNFSHIGGFCMGFLLSIALLQDPSFVYQDGIYTYDADTPTWRLFVNNWNPLNKRSDKILWKVLVWACVRIAALVLAILYFVLLAKNLESQKLEEGKDSCSWCKYINCIPVHDWCDIGEITVDSDSTSTSATATDTSATSTTAAIFNAPTETANLKRDLWEAPQELHGDMVTHSPIAHSSSVYGIVALAVLMSLMSARMIKKFTK